MRYILFTLALFISFGQTASQELQIDRLDGTIYPPFYFATSDSVEIIAAPQFNDRFLSKKLRSYRDKFDLIETLIDEKVYFAGKVLDRATYEEIKYLAFGVENRYAGKSAKTALSIIEQEIDNLLYRNLKYEEDFYFGLYPMQFEDLLNMIVKYSFPYNEGETIYNDVDNSFTFIDECNYITKEISRPDEDDYIELTLKNYEDFFKMNSNPLIYLRWFKLKLTCVSENKKSSWVYRVELQNDY